MSITKKITAISISLATVVSLSGVFMAMPVAQAVTTEELQAQITALLAQITLLQQQLANAQGTTTTTTSFSFTKDLTLGSKGDEVKALQELLISANKGSAAAALAAVGATSYFGSLTKAALAEYQAAAGVTPSVGYFGPKTRAYVASLGTVVTTSGTVIGTTTGTTTGVTVTGEALAVSLAVDSPAAAIIGSGTAFNSALKVNLSAGSKDVTITGITLQKGGFVANTRLNGVDVLDSQGVRHGQVVTSVNADNTITILMSSDPIVVKAGSNETLKVRFNLTGGDYSGTIAFGIASASAITSDAVSVSGTFPLNGATMSVVNGGNSLASTTLAILASTGSSTLNVDPNSQQEITKFRIAETASQEGVYLHSWTFYNYGNAAATDYQDVQLIAQDGTVLATAQPSSQYVKFVLADPYFIDKGLTKDFTIKAKIVNGTTKTIKLVTYNDYDIDLRGSTTGVSVIPSAAAGTADTTFPIGNAYNQTTIGSGSITLQRASDSPSSAVTPGSTNVVLAKYIAKPTGENYELRQVKFWISSSTGATALTGTIYVKVNGAIVYSVGASGISVTSATTVNLSSYPILVAGQDSTITIEGTISSSATASDNYKVEDFDLTSVKRLVSNDLLSENDSGLNVTAVDGLSIAVKAAKLAITNLITPVANSMVVGTNNAELAQIQLNASAGGEDIKISSITVACAASDGVTDIANLLMYKDNETSPLATTASTATNASTLTFSFSTPIVVPKTTSVLLHLKGNVVADSGSGAGTLRFRVASTTSAVSATGYSTGNSLTHGTDITYAGNGQTMTVVSTGQLVLSLVSGSGASPSSNQVMNTGTTGAAVFAFKLTSQYETQKITSLTLRATSSASDTLATSTLRNIRLYEGSSATPFAEAAQFDACKHSDPNATSTNCYVTFPSVGGTADNLLSAPVPTTGVTIYVKADVATGGTARLGDYFKFLIASSTSDITVKGSVSGLTTATRTGTPAVSGMTYVTPQSVKIEAVSPTSASQIGLSAGQTIGVFKISNNGSNPVYLATSTFAFANGGSATTSVGFKIYASTQGGGQSDTSAWNSGNGYAAAAGTTGASSTVSFATTTMTSAEQLINGGSWRYVTIKTTGVAANNDTFQFSVSALGNVLFDVSEADLGYSGNYNGTSTGDTDITDTIYGLYVDGIPALGTVTAKT